NQVLTSSPAGYCARSSSKRRRRPRPRPRCLRLPTPDLRPPTSIHPKSAPCSKHAPARTFSLATRVCKCPFAAPLWQTLVRQILVGQTFLSAKNPNCNLRQRAQQRSPTLSRRKQPLS